MKKTNTKLLSIIVPVYNVEKYLRDFLDSLLSQDSTYFEVICVDDASTDSSNEILEEYRTAYPEIKIINKERNEGLGFARNTGLQHAKCSYVIFFDPDDYLKNNAITTIVTKIIKTNPDILVFGTELFHETDIRKTKEDINWYELKFSGGKDFNVGMLLNINVEVWNKVFKRSIIEKFNIQFPVNIYEDVDFSFKYAVHTKTIIFIAEKLYVYRQREGSLMSTTLNRKQDSLLVGLSVCKSLKDYYDKHKVSEDYYIVLLKLFVRNFFYARAYIRRENHRELLSDARKSLEYISLDYKVYKHDLTDEEYNLLDDLSHNNHNEIFRYEINSPNIKILISYHIPSYLIRSEILMPIHVGRGMRDGDNKDGKHNNQDLTWLIDNMIGDDTGDNISNKNSIYAELTAQYWAWKNQDKLGNPEYIGFMHYRRHFMFRTPGNFKENCSATEFVSIDKYYISEVGLFDNNIISSISGNDGIVYKPFYVDINVYDQFKDLSEQPWDLDVSIFDEVIKIIQNKHPEYLSSCYKYLDSKKHYWFNMYIFKKELFDEYMEWLFSILFEAESNINFEKYSVQGKRVLAYIAERLFGIFITQKVSGKIKLQELPVSFVNKTALERSIKPTFDFNNIPIVIASDNKYVKYVSVVLNSIIENSHLENNYDIYILNDNISEYSKKIISGIIDNKNNFNVQFIDVSLYVSQQIKDIFYVHNYISIATYFRFFIELIFKEFEKVIYLDCDIVVEKDVAQLMEVDLNNKILAACRDFETMRLVYKENDWQEYHRNVLEIKDSNNYFQAGVIVYNIKRLIQNNTLIKLLGKLKEVQSPRFVDQDILNSVLQNNIKFLDSKWNFQWYIEIHDPEFHNIIPRKYYNEYKKGKSNPSIIHFNGSLKPWHDPDVEYAKDFWKYAKASPFYESILKDLIKYTLIDFNNSAVTISLQDNPRLLDPLSSHNYQRSFSEGNSFKLRHQEIYRLFTSRLRLHILDYRLIKKSSLFDEIYYLNSNSDVDQANINPLKHYVKYGWKEGRNPNSWFNTNVYLSSYKDVKVKGINPLCHYILYGKKEDRRCS